MKTDEKNLATVRTGNAEQMTRVVSFLVGAGYDARLRGIPGVNPYAAMVPLEEFDSALKTIRIGGV